MKKILQITLLGSVLALFACSKEMVDNTQTAPQQVIDAFKANFPDIEGVNFYLAGTYIEANYKENGLERAVFFNEKGNIVAMETELSPTDLMPSIKDYLTQHYPTHNIMEVEKSEVPKGTFYEVELSQREVEVELIFDENGNFVAVEDEEEEDEEADEEEKNEKEIAPSALPEVIKASIDTQYPGAEVLEVDEITQEDGSITYDVEIRFEGKVTEVMYNEQGKFLGIEVDDEDDDEDEEEHGDHDHD